MRGNVIDLVSLIRIIQRLSMAEIDLYGYGLGKWSCS